MSTEEQANSGLGVEAQTEAITTACANRGWTVEVVADLGRSGKQVNPELRRALDLLSSGQADGLVLAKLDRLARSVRHASAIIDDAQRQGWDLVVLDNAIDLTTPGGRAMPHDAHAGRTTAARARSRPGCCVASFSPETQAPASPASPASCRQMRSPACCRSMTQASACQRCDRCTPY